MEPVPATEPFQVDLLRLPEEIFEPDSVAEAPLVRFVAYTRHHRVYGWVRLQADRLTDLLNAHASLLLTDVEVEALEGGSTQSVDRVEIAAADLVAVHASGPRGDAAQRRRTRSHAVALQAGHYLIGGHLHVDPGADALVSLDDRPAMVPLTDAWVEYWSAGERARQAIGTIIVNRRAADWIRLVSDDDLVEGLLHPAPVIGCP